MKVNSWIPGVFGPIIDVVAFYEDALVVEFVLTKENCDDSFGCLEINAICQTNWSPYSFILVVEVLLLWDFCL